MKIAIIYHAYEGKFNCPDGLAAAWVAAKVYPDAELIKSDYVKKSDPKPPDVLGFDRLVIVDLSFPGEVLNLWRDKEVLIIDHHASAWEILSKLDSWVSDRLIFNQKMCGATLTWHHFFPFKDVPDFLKMVQDRDIGSVWQEEGDRFWDCPGNIFHYGSSAYGRSFELYDRLEPMKRSQILRFLEPYARPLIEERKAKVESVLSRLQVKKIEGKKVAFFRFENESENGLRSEVGKFACERNPVDFCLMINTFGKIELRSKGDRFNCWEFASRFGGGGHFNAAGCPGGEEIYKLIGEQKAYGD